MTTMAWSEADQNPSLAPTAGSGSPNYATMLNSYAYGSSSGSGMAPSPSSSSSQQTYAQRLNGAAPAQPKQTTSRALEKSASQPPPAAGNYTIRKGDTLWGIAQAQLGDPNRWREIAAANGLKNPNRIRPGQSLMIPGLAQQTADIPTPRPRPTRNVAGQPDPGRFSDAFAYAPPPETMTDVPFDAVTEGGIPTPRMNPRRQQPTVQWNIDGALDAVESTRLAQDLGERRRAMEANQPAYRGGNPQGVNRSAKSDRALPEAEAIDWMTRTDAADNYVMPQNVGGARPEGPAGRMPAAPWQPTVAGRQERPGALPPARWQPTVAAREGVPGALPAARTAPAPTYDDLTAYMNERFGPGGYTTVDPAIVSPPPQARPQRAAPLIDSRALAGELANRRQMMEAAARPPVRQPPPGRGPESETGVYGDPSAYPPEAFGRGPEADARDAMRERFGDSFAPAAPGVIADLPGAYAARNAPPTINQPAGPPIFTTPSGIRVWAAR